jgi:hypothetical protein
MSQPAKAQEPSMEEILASIRRIIADDDASRTQAKPSEPEKAPPAPPAAPPPVSAVSPPPPESAVNQGDVDAMMGQADAPPGEAEPESPPDIFDLTESMTAPQPASAPDFRKIDGEPDVVFHEPQEAPPPEPEPEPAPEPAISRTVEEARRQFAQGTGERSLLSSETSAVVDSAFNSLAHTVLVQNARTLEDLVREMLRPMLKAWLDDNLPGMVERLVRAEIERVSRGR